MSVDGTINRFLGEPIHLSGMRVGEPLHIPSIQEYFDAVGRVLLGDYYAYVPVTPFNLADGPGPQVLTSFLWSANPYDGITAVNLTPYFYQAQILNERPYTAWRVRGLYLFNGELVAVGTTGLQFTPLDGGNYALNLSGSGNLINPLPGDPNSAWYMGGPPGQSMDFPDRPTYFQLEVGYNGGPSDIHDQGANWDWPAWGSPITVVRP